VHSQFGSAPTVGAGAEAEAKRLRMPLALHRMLCFSTFTIIRIPPVPAEAILTAILRCRVEVGPMSTKLSPAAI
jgi:hypothetical protein